MKLGSKHKNIATGASCVVVAKTLFAMGGEFQNNDKSFWFSVYSEEDGQGNTVNMVDRNTSLYDGELIEHLVPVTVQTDEDIIDDEEDEDGIEAIIYLTERGEIFASTEAYFVNNHVEEAINGH